MRFKDKVVVVTGSSRGIGREMALAYAREGANVTINYLNSQEEAEKTANEIKNLGKTPLLFKGNVSDHDSMIRMMKETHDEFGRLDILINNAAIYKDSTVWKMDKSVWDEVIDVGLTGVFNCTKGAVPYMKQQGWGRVLTISSVVGQIGTFGTSNYSAAKSGIFGFTKSVAKETAKNNITINALSLGFIDIGMLKRLPENVQEIIIRQIPMGRWGKIDEVTKTAMFMTSEDASYITGQIINVNGGFYM